MENATKLKLIQREGAEWERVVFAEVLIPDTPNSFGDISSREQIKQFAYEYARQGYGLDVDHNQIDVAKVDYYVAETFIARDGDPDFIPGSWVVGCKIISDDLWAKVLDGSINGYSYEAEVFMTPVVFSQDDYRQISGVTHPDLTDGHVHEYVLFIDPYNKPIVGATSESNGHSHRISVHTVTDVSEGHNHRYQVLV